MQIKGVVPAAGRVPRSRSTATGAGAAARAILVLLVPVMLMAVAPPLRAAGLDVVVTVKPVHALVARVMQGLGEPKLLIDGRASPHAFSLRPSQARVLAEADVFVRVSPDLETFTQKTAGLLKKGARVVTLMDAPGLQVRPTRKTATFGEDDHDKGSHHKDDHGHKGQHHDDDHDHGATDTHIWLDPENAKVIVGYVAKVLSEVMPQSKEIFARNAEAARGEIDATSTEVRAVLIPAAGRPFVVFHDAYQYYEQRFGLTALGALTLHPEVTPSARRLTSIRAELREHGGGCVFAEPQFPERIINAVTEGTNWGKGVLDPLGADLAPGPQLYGQLLLGLAATFAGCLGRS
ncbi:MAG: zinc ABC transporter substrate-binding protein [Hyphomicrobiaceae bacterium]